jgi:hypothetical protein
MEERYSHKDLHDLELKVLHIEQNIMVDISKLKGSVEELNKAITRLVSIERFNPVAYIAYGLAGGVLTTALGAILSKVFI